MSLKSKKRSPFNNVWITENALEVITHYEKGILTLRGLHYRLVSKGMTNDLLHYKAVVRAMIIARWDGTVDFWTFSDHDRGTIGKTEYEETNLDDQVSYGKRQIHAWMNHYSKNRWENQDDYVEIWIEKKALQGVFESVCNDYNVLLAPCKGYPSLTFLNEASARFQDAEIAGKCNVILYFGDHDPSGDDIPRSIKENLNRMGINIELKRIALNKQQVIDMSLPPAPIKLGDSRSSTWDGLGQVELDAIEPQELQIMCKDAIEDHFDENAYEDLKETEDEERIEYRNQLKDYVQNL